MTFFIRKQNPDDTRESAKRQDFADIFLQKYERFLVRFETQHKNDLPYGIVKLRLSLMKTMFEKRGFLSLPYIDNIIRQVIIGFKNKHNQETIKKEHWDILTDMCKQEIDRMSRIEPDELTDPVDIDVDDIDFNAWINSEV